MHDLCLLCAIVKRDHSEQMSAFFQAHDISTVTTLLCEGTAGKKLLDLSSIDESIRFLLSGEVEAEFRTTVVKNFHEAEDLLKITDWISGCDRFFLQQFVDSGNLIDPSLSGYSDDELLTIYKQVKRKLPVTKIRGISEN